MKTALRISVGFNVVLLGAVIFVSLAGRKPAPVPTLIRQSPPTAVAPTAAQVPPRGEPPAFRWSQLDSPDYHVYVKNLRTAGCPEPTVRAIVTADADAVYRRFRLNLEQKLAEFSGGSWSNQLASAAAQPALRAELQRLPDEESWLIADLLGLVPATNQMAAATPPAAPPPLPSAASQPVALPLVFQNFDPVALNLNDEQRQVIASVRQNFLEQIGSSNLNTNDPAYLARWQEAQPAADNMLQGMLGGDVFIKFQMLQMLAQNQGSQ
jgi:hypothetical protein